jgi:hypothetical protein
MHSTTRIVFIALALCAGAYGLHAQGTAFTYQGRLNDHTAPAAGTYDLQFTVYDDPTAGNSVGSPLTNSATAVSNGLFTVQLDFGPGIFDGSPRWLEIGVRTNGAGSFSTLIPRQALTAAPYAILAGNAAAVAAVNVTGTLGLSQLPVQLVTNGAAGLSLDGSFTGNAGGLTNVSPRAIASTPVLSATPIGSIVVGTNPQCVAVSGRYAYVANYASKTLQIVDVNTPSNPQLLGAVTTSGNPIAVAAAGRYVYIEFQFSTSLEVIDVSNPASPIGVAVIPTGNFPAFIAASGRYAYIVNSGASTLMIADLNSPTNPVIIATIATGAGPVCVAVSGHYVYVTCSNGSLLDVFDVDVPSAPVLVGTVATDTNPDSVAVVGRYAYVACAGASKLDVIDISSATAPTVTGTIATGAFPASVAVAGRFAFLANRNANSLQAIDVSNPTNPITAGSVTAGGQPVSVAVVGRYAYVANYSGKTLQIFDLGGAYLQELESGSLETGTLQTRDSAAVGNNLDVRGGLSVSGSARFAGGVSGDGSGLIALKSSQLTGVIPAALLTDAYSLTNPGNVIAGNGASLTNLNATNIVGLAPPGAALSSTFVGTNPVCIAVSGRYAYVACYNSKTLQIVDVSTPGSPQTMGAVNTSGNPIAVAVAGRYAYLEYQFSTTLQVIDISNPWNPFVVGSVPTGNFPQFIALSGRYAFVANHGAGTMMVVDVNSPTNPVVIATVSTHSGPYAVAVVGHYVYVVCNLDNVLDVIDIAVPSLPVLVGICGTDATPQGVAVVGRYAYVACSGAGLLDVLDVSDPTSPGGLGSVATGSNPTSVAVAGRYAYVADSGSADVAIVDVSIPWEPAMAGTIPTDPNPTSLAVVGKYAYVANNAAETMQVFDLGGAYLQHLEAGAVEMSSLQTRDSAVIGNNLDVRGGLTVAGSARFGGTLGVSSLNTVSLFATNFTALNFNVPGLLLTNGNVGIDTATPETRLQVGNYGSTADRYITVATAGGNHYRSGLNLRHFNSGYGWTLVSDERDSTFRLLSHFNDTNGIARLIVDRFTGNVSIGTNYPGHTLDVGGAVFATGGFIGDGSGVTNISASQIAAGTVSDTRLSGNVALLNAAQTFTGTNAFAGITSPKWKATSVISSVGALPLSNTLSCSGGTLLIFVSGSGRSTGGGTLIGMNVQIDGVTIDTCTVLANPAATHLAFVPKTIVRTGVAPGSHTIGLIPTAGTTTDLNDNFNVTVTELPF